MQREKNMTYATAGVQMGAGIEMNVRSHVFIPDAEAGCEEVRSHYHAGYQVVRKKEITLSRNHAAILLLILAGILAATMSTADSQLLASASAFASDVYKPIIRKNKTTDKEILWVGRIVVLIVAVVGFIIAASGINNADSWANSIMSMVENAWGLFGASFGPVVILSLFWRRFNYAGACAGIITGAAVDIFWLLTCTNTIIKNPLIGVTGVYEVLPGFVAGLIAAVVVSLATKAPSSEVDAIFASATDESIDD